ncbi:MAG: hypothetical protein RM049_29280 [Nostoc sp. DedQUE04]|uniref:hypothetical protein n=1 Tax=Nostoc sp. DedQUE04 TaxID=3075390 RepID=UPI002AD2B8F5|nr:hypothetical protein [Nostoc sp. DedQUE04]MDZ8139331.1 hypothetical protein [Nostoc sp. DedQUE04]
MKKFAVKSLITLVVTSSALLLAPMRSDAQININRLTQVAKSCQEDILSFNYYKRMGFDTNSINYYLKNSYNQEQAISHCVYSRYHYSSVLTKYAWLDSTGEILAGYPGSVVVASLASVFGGYDKTSILDCIVNQDISSQECSLTKSILGSGVSFRDRVQEWYTSYKVNVCPSCVLAHDEVYGSREEILKAFIKWFFTLEKTQRRELISLLGDGDQARKLRLVIAGESSAALKKYLEVRQEVQEQEQERRRQDVLGN